MNTYYSNAYYILVGAKCQVANHTRHHLTKAVRKKMTLPVSFRIAGSVSLCLLPFKI